MIGPQLPNTDWYDGFVEFTDGFNVWELLTQLLQFVGSIITNVYNFVAFFFTPLSTLVDKTVGDQGFLFELLGDLIASILDNVTVGNPELGLTLGNMTIFSIMFLLGAVVYIIFTVIRYLLSVFGL